MLRIRTSIRTACWCVSQVSDRSRSNMELARMGILTYLLLGRASGRNTWRTSPNARRFLNWQLILWIIMNSAWRLFELAEDKYVDFDGRLFFPSHEGRLQLKYLHRCFWNGPIDQMDQDHVCCRRASSIAAVNPESISMRRIRGRLLKSPLLWQSIFRLSSWRRGLVH